MEKDLRIKELEEELENLKDQENQTSEFRNKEGNNINSELNSIEFTNSIIENIQAPLLLLNNHFEVIHANRAFYKTFQTTKEEIEGRDIFKIWSHEGNIAGLKDKLKRIISENLQLSNFEINQSFENIGEKWFKINGSKIQNPQKSSDYILLTLEDISVQKKTEENLKSNEELLQEMIYSSTSLIALLKGPEFIIEIANDAMKNMWGKGPDVIGKPVFQVVPEVEEQGIKELLEEVYQTCKPYHAKERPVYHNVNGEIIKSYFDFTYQPHCNADGKVVGVGVIAQDVTQQAILNERIKASEKEFREMLDFMPHRITVTDKDGNTKYCNQSWLDYSGCTLTEFLERDSSEFTHPDEREKIEKAGEDCLSNEEDLYMELRIKDKHGKYRWHLCRGIPIRNENNEIISWITSSTEIHKLKEEEKRKEDFLKLVSHELKTPVTSIKGYVQLLLSMLHQENTPDNSVPVKPYLQRIENQVERLIRLIAEMLDLSRIEQNELELRKDEFNLNKQVEEIVEDLIYSNKEIDIHLQHDFECNVKADRDRIGQVIINFVTNALKYSPNSKRVDIRIFEEKENYVAISVKDYGIGIDEKEQQQIFKRFYRISGNKDETYSGFGIGLYLSNEIIERHKGKIKVNSEIGKGSEFIFTLPLNNN